MVSSVRIVPAASTPVLRGCLCSDSGCTWQAFLRSYVELSMAMGCSDRKGQNYILSMEEIRRSPVEDDSLSHYLKDFMHPWWLTGFLNHQQYDAMLVLFCLSSWNYATVIFLYLGPGKNKQSLKTTLKFYNSLS